MRIPDCLTHSRWQPLAAIAIVLGLLSTSALAQESDAFYDDAFYGDEYAGDNDHQNVGEFGYDAWARDWDEQQQPRETRYEYDYSTTTATSGGNDNAWWQRSRYYNEDEWYDPTDWFDGNNYEYDAPDVGSGYDTTSANDPDDDYLYYDYDDEYGDEVYDYGYDAGAEGEDSYDAGYDFGYYDDPPP